MRLPRKVTLRPNAHESARIQRLLPPAPNRQSAKEQAAFAALAAAIREFRFRDLRAKAATEKNDLDGMSATQDLLGHSSENIARQYVRHRVGKRLNPTK